MPSLEPNPNPTDNPFISALADLGINPATISDGEITEFAKVVQDARILGAGLLVFIADRPEGQRYVRLDPKFAEIINREEREREEREGNGG